MSDILEVVITSDANGGPYTMAVWDVRTGTNLLTYKGGGAASTHAVDFIRNEFLVAANSSKPLIHMWPVNSPEQVQSARFVMPGRVTALTISPDGNFCVAGVSETVYVWQICSGLMLASLSKHYQPVTTIRFTDDGSHFVSAGQDGMVIVWNLTNVISGQTDGHQTPAHTFSDHALSVTDLYLGHGGLRAMLCSVSLDRTCKIYDLASGGLLLNLVFEEPLSVVTIDHLESNVFVGTNKGSIFSFSLTPPPRLKEFHVSKDAVNKFDANHQNVTCLSISLDGETLISGGTDENVFVWHIPSKQLIRTLPHKGAITNAFFTLAPKFMFDQEIKLNLIASNFQRMIYNPADLDNHIVEIVVKEKNSDEKPSVGKQLPDHHFESTSRTSNSQKTEDDIRELRKENLRLKEINKKMFEYSLKNILK